MEMWPTPVCQDSRHAISRHLDPENKFWKSNLGEVVMSMEKENTGRLNPTWVEWLMGWPLEWTDLKPLETDKFHYVQQPHLTCSKQDLVTND
jgi:DNA (cytosine-5)-methyltransferase 1